MLGQSLFRRPGNSEINHTRHRLALAFRDEHVRRLYASVDDSFLMCVLDGAADQLEKLQSLARRRALAIAITCDRTAVDQLHHEVRVSQLGRAGVQDPGDMGMIDRGQRAALGVEAYDHLTQIDLGLDDFQRDLAYRRGGLLGDVDDPERLRRSVPADCTGRSRPPALHERRFIVVEVDVGEATRVERTSVTEVLGQQPLDVIAKRRDPQGTLRPGIWRSASGESNSGRLTEDLPHSRRDITHRVKSSPSMPHRCDKRARSGRPLVSNSRNGFVVS